MQSLHGVVYNIASLSLSLSLSHNEKMNNKVDGLYCIELECVSMMQCARYVVMLAAAVSKTN